MFKNTNLHAILKNREYCTVSIRGIGEGILSRSKIKKVLRTYLNIMHTQNICTLFHIFFKVSFDILEYQRQTLFRMNNIVQCH